MTSDAAGATAIANAIVASPTTLTGASFDAVPPGGTPNGTADAPLSAYPTDGSTFGILTTGDVTLADQPNLSGADGADIGGANVRGDTDFDVSVLKLDLTAPIGSNCLGLDFAFYSEEFPEFVGSAFNDGFIVELDHSTWTTAGSTISAPDNIAFDSNGNVVSINSSGPTAMTAGNAAGTTYDGATVPLQAHVPVTPGAHTLYLSIFDQGDHILDSAAFIDNVHFAAVADPAVDCKTGAVPVAAPTSTTYSGPSSVQYSDPVTLSGTLLDTSVSPAIGLAGQQLDFTLGSQSTSAGPTDAGGSATASPLQILQTPGAVTNVTTSFAGDSAHAASQDVQPFSITKEDCTLGYSGDLLVPPLTNTTLSADLGELDTSVGDLSGKTVTFNLSDAAGNVQTVTATTNASGLASTSVPLPAGVYAVSAAFTGDAFYKPCATATDALLTVSAAGAKVTGGGWTSISTGKVSFGFNAIPQAGGLFKGQFQLRSSNGKNKFHGNVVSSLTGTANTATWSGTGSWNGTAGYTYSISVVDNGSSGAKKSDTISITIKSAGGVTVFSTSGAPALKGGNITVH